MPATEIDIWSGQREVLDVIITYTRDTEYPMEKEDSKRVGKFVGKLSKRLLDRLRSLVPRY